MSKKYKLLKDLPGADAGTIFEIKSDNLRVYQSNDLGCLVHCGINDKHLPAISMDYLNSDWFEEVKEIPENQAWVVPSTKYRNKEWSPNQYFIPSEFNFSKNHWEGTNTIFGILEGLRDGANNRVPYFKNKYDFQAMTSKDEWEEYIEPEKPKRKAPAYFKAPTIYVPSGVGVSTSLFSSKEEAKDYMPDTFLDWPALPDSEGYYPGPKEKE